MCMWVDVRVAILNCVVSEGPTEQRTFVQRAKGSLCGYLLEEHSR